MPAAAGSDVILLPPIRRANRRPRAPACMQRATRGRVPLQPSSREPAVLSTGLDCIYIRVSGAKLVG